MARKRCPKFTREVKPPSGAAICRVILTEGEKRRVDRMEDVIREAAASGIKNPRLRKKIQALARKLKK